MKKLITFSVYLFGISIVLMAANLPTDWVNTVDDLYDGLLFQTNVTSETNTDLAEVQKWLNEGDETPETTYGINSICLDDAGTVTRTLGTGGAAGIIQPLCWGNNYIITHDGNGIFSGDGNPLTQAGLDLMIFTDVPTFSGPLVSDIAMNTGYTGNVVGTNPSGSITLTNLGTYQNFYGTNAQGYTELWFAPVTIDDVTSTPKTLSEDVGGANECVNVNVNAAFQIVFLDSIHINNFMTPSGNNLCQASFTVSGGMMAYNGMNYTVTIEEVNDPTITGTITVNPTPTHNSQVVFTVPQAGSYNLSVNDGCTTKTIVVDMSACVSCTDDAGTLTTSISSGSNSTNPLYLCFGDTLNITHNGDQNVAGDPNPATTPGVQYAMYTCLPTITGPTLNAILGDPCLITNSGGSVPQLASNTDINGNGFLSNSNGLYQGYLTGQFLSPVDTLFFAPITVDEYPGTWEGVTGPNECTNVNINAAFSVVFLSDLVVQSVNNQSGGNLCRGEVTAFGGLPQADGSNYIVTVELMSNPTITGTVITPASHGGTTIFEVPQPGNYRILVTDGNGCITSQAFVGMSSCTTPCANFQLTGGISSNYNGANISCIGASDGSIEIIPTGGSYPFTYAWSHNAGLTDSIATGLGVGSYTVTVTDDDGCVHDTTITLVSPSFVSVAVIGDGPLCSGDATGMVWVYNNGGGTQPYTYTWSNGASGNDTIFNLLAGGYALTITDANGCTGQASTTISDPPVLNANFTTVNDATCEGINDGDATISATGGTSPYSYTWSHDAALTTATATNLAVGRYYVTTTDNNLCTTVDSVDIAATLVVSATSAVTDVNCFGGNDGEILVTPLTSGGAPNLPYTYSWSPNTAELTNNATALTTGNYIYTVTDNVGCIYIDSAVVNQPDSITITNVSTTNVLCNGATNGEIIVSASGGAGGYAYDWGNGNTDSTLSNVAAGTYTVTVTDANGCTNTLTITLAQPPAIIANGSSTNVSCNGFTDGTATVAPTGGTGVFAYAWSTNPAIDTFASVTGLAAGQYYVTITDASACLIIDTVDITQPTALVANTNATDQSCFNVADGTATAAPTGGTAPYTYLWSDASVNDTLTGLTAATYFVTVTDANGCNVVDSAVVDAPPAITATTSTTPVSCQGGTDGTATVTGAAGGSGSFTYLWSNNQIGQTASGLGAGNYTVTITDGVGCTLVETVSVVELPPLNPAGGIIANPVSCFGGSDGSIEILGMTGGTAPYAYTWSTTPVQDSSVAIDLTAGVYSVIITDANGCTFGPVNVTVNQPVAAVAGTITTIDPSCNGEADGSVSIDATGGTPSYTYLWSDGQTTQTASNLPIGTYDVTITDANGCTSTASGTLIQPDPLTAEASTLPTSCNGTRDGRIILDTAYGGSEPYAYSIDGVNYQPIDIIFFGLAGGNYDVYVQDGNGCIFEQQVNIAEPPLIVVDLGADIELELGDNVMLEAIVNTTDSLTYTWGSSPGDSSMSCVDCPTPMIAPVRSTTYTVTVRDTSGCTATDDIFVKLDKNRNVFIPNGFTPNGDGRNDEFMVFAGTGVVRIKTFMIYDRWGNQLYAQTDIQPNDPSVGWDGRFRGELMTPGVYVFFIEIEFADGLVFPYKGDITLIR